MDSSSKKLSASAKAFSPRRAHPRAYYPRSMPLSRPVHYGRYYSEMIDLERERIRAKIAVLQHEEEFRRFKKFRQEKQHKQKIKPKKKATSAAKPPSRGFKSKQKKINIVFESLAKKFRETGLLREEVHRSYETTRVHAKTFDGLVILTEALDRVIDDKEIEIIEIGFHKSMKNKYQQKGILVYIKVGSQDQVDRLFEIYNSYGRDLKDHAIAVTKEEREKLQAMKDAKAAALAEEAGVAGKDTTGVEPVAEVETNAVGIKAVWK